MNSFCKLLRVVLGVLDQVTHRLALCFADGCTEFVAEASVALNSLWCVVFDAEFMEFVLLSDLSFVLRCEPIGALFWCSFVAFNDSGEGLLKKVEVVVRREVGGVSVCEVCAYLSLELDKDGVFVSVVVAC